LTINTRTIFTGGALLAVAGASVLFACSSNQAIDPGPGTSPTATGEAGVKPPDSGDRGNPTTDGGVTGDAADDGAASCRTARLYPTTADKGVFCPYSGVDGGKDINCPKSTACCQTQKASDGDSKCQPLGSACPATDSGVPAWNWECEDSVNCGTGKVCCGAVTLEPNPDCPYSFGKDLTKTACKTTCAADEKVICQAQSSCTTGTCTPFRISETWMGTCK
jgi:hypothetical protein